MGILRSRQSDQQHSNRDAGGNRILDRRDLGRNALGLPTYPSFVSCSLERMEPRRVQRRFVRCALTALKSLGGTLQVAWGYPDQSWQVYDPNDQAGSTLSEFCPGAATGSRSPARRHGTGGKKARQRLPVETINLAIEFDNHQYRKEACHNAAGEVALRHGF